MSLSVVSCNTLGDEASKRLVKSCQKYGYSLSFYRNTFYGFRDMKLNSLIPYLKTLTSDYVMYTDSTDSWFLKPDILDIYKENFDGLVMVSGNRDHYPHTNLYNTFPEAPTSMRYVCCSQFIGPREEVINTLESIKSNWTHGDTDQEGWHLCFVNKLANINIDYYCKLFLNMTNVSLDELDSEFRFKETGNIPASLHFGGAKGSSPNGLNFIKAYETWERIA